MSNHPVEDHRAIFKAAVQQYLDLRAQQVRVKQKLKAKYQGWGVTSVEGTRVYGADSRVEFLRRAPQGPIRSQLRRLYELMDEALALQQSAWREVQRLGSRYPEIGIFQKISWCGQDRGAHLRRLCSNASAFYHKAKALEVLSVRHKRPEQ